MCYRYNLCEHAINPVAAAITGWACQRLFR